MANSGRGSGSEDPDLLSMLARLMGTTPEALAGDDADAVRARLAQVRSAVGRLIAAGSTGSPPSSPADDVDEEKLRAGAAELRAALARAGIDTGSAPSGDAARPGGEAQVELQALARAFHIMTEFLEQRRPGLGAEVDALTASLDKAFGKLRGEEAARAARDERIASDVRGSIADHLRRVGIKPSGDS